MGHHHALGLAGRTRGVDQHGQVDIDAARRRRQFSGRRGHETGPIAFGALAGIGAVDDDDATQARRLCRGSTGNGEQRGLGDQDRGLAVVQHVGELVGLGGRIDDAEDATGAQGAENADGGLEAVVGEQYAALAVGEAGVGHQPGRKPLGAGLEVGIARAHPLADQGDAVGIALGSAAQQTLVADHPARPASARLPST